MTGGYKFCFDSNLFPPLAGELVAPIMLPRELTGTDPSGMFQSGCLDIPPRTLDRRVRVCLFNRWPARSRC